MFEIKISSKGDVILFGRFDASQVEKAKIVFNQISTSTNVDFQDLEYISSAGLGVLLMTQKRLAEMGHSLRLLNLNKHIRDVFHYAGFDKIFAID